MSAVTVELAPAAHDWIGTALLGRRNSGTAMALVRWLVSRGHHHRTEKPFAVVRGSHPGQPGGVKDDAVAISFGLTESKIRGALKTLVEEDVIERIPDEHDLPTGGRRILHRDGRAYTPEVLYRFSKRVLRLLRGSKVGTKLADPPLEEPFLLASIDATLPELDHNRGEHLSPLDRRIEEARAAIEAAPMEALPVVEASPVVEAPRPTEDDLRISTPADQRWLLAWPIHAATRPSTWPRIYEGRALRPEVLAWVETHIGVTRRSWHRMDPGQHGHEIRLGVFTREDLDAFVEAWGVPS